MKVEWRIYPSINYHIVGSDIGLSPAWRQASTWPNDVLLVVRPIGTTSMKYDSKFNILYIKEFLFRQQNAGHFVSTPMS